MLMKSQPQSHSFPLFRSMCTRQFVGSYSFIVITCLLALFGVGIWYHEDIYGKCEWMETTKAHLKGAIQTDEKFEQWFIWVCALLIPQIIVRIVVVIYSITAPRIEFDAMTNMISVPVANFFCGCCTAPRIAWESHINDIIIACYYAKPYCGRTMYGVMLLTMKKNLVPTTAENPEGYQLFAFEDACDEYCLEEFIAVVKGIKANQPALKMKIVDATGVPQDELGRIFRGPVHEAEKRYINAGTALGNEEGKNSFADMFKFNYQGQKYNM